MHLRLNQGASDSSSFVGSKNSSIRLGIVFGIHVAVGLTQHSVPSRQATNDSPRFRASMLVESGPPGVKTMLGTVPVLQRGPPNCISLVMCIPMMQIRNWKLSIGKFAEVKWQKWAATVPEALTVLPSNYAQLIRN